MGWAGSSRNREKRMDSIGLVAPLAVRKRNQPSGLLTALPVTCEPCSVIAEAVTQTKDDSKSHTVPRDRILQEYGKPRAGGPEC